MSDLCSAGLCDHGGVEPPTVAMMRGFASLVALMDERDPGWRDRPIVLTEMGTYDGEDEERRP